MPKQRRPKCGQMPSGARAEPVASTGVRAVGVVEATRELRDGGVPRCVRPKPGPCPRTGRSAIPRAGSTSVPSRKVPVRLSPSVEGTCSSASASAGLHPLCHRRPLRPKLHPSRPAQPAPEGPRIRPQWHLPLEVLESTTSLRRYDGEVRQIAGLNGANRARPAHHQRLRIQPRGLALPVRSAPARRKVHR